MVRDFGNIGIKWYFLSGIQPNVKPSGIILGTSFNECIAISISLLNSSF